MGFGFDQLGKTTPQRVKYVRDAIIWFLAGCLAFSSLFCPKLGISGEDYAQWIGFLIIAIKFICKFFGVSDDEAVKNVVSAIEEVKKDQ